MKKIGMIGGLSWVATAEYYRRLNQLIQAECGGATSARIVIESVNRQDYLDAMHGRGDEDAACAIIADAAGALEAAGAEFIVLACNNAHRFVPRIAPTVALRFLHIAEVTARAIAAQGCRRVALLGVRKTMEDDFYPSIFADHGIETLIPTEPDRAIIDDTIHRELVNDRFLDATRDEYGRIIAALAARGAEGVALACTEIPLLLGPDDACLPLYSTTELHCRAAVAMALQTG
ncbi:amino acid racemase [Paracoccus sp. 1_MG-2023]|uniref:aspartate/glutamate racemase family protein n=1 Tax=unclassified Paracoccus (in: a-proteobacteria) TaxID=2688777 RepID=UPI001C09111B|nr:MULTISPECIES: amino acid racemase [unclassified Paracoccus (in: a-proteobacteria)]MBU2957859.1 amino acid racemase [Paracoccus sp. C2R09]MDO6667293.1 amino acid racemase [Paracoccus sp. 1_MG-2023]